LYNKEQDYLKMFVELDIENISLVIQNEDEYGTPLSRLTFNKMSLNMK
jgi:hypothetical protein